MTFFLKKIDRLSVWPKLLAINDIAGKTMKHKEGILRMTFSNGEYKYYLEVPLENDFQWYWRHRLGKK